MKSAAAMSLEIRRKKKEMRDNPEVVDLSGIPMDKTEEDVEEQNQLTTELGMDKNHAKMREEEPSVMEDERVDASDDSHEEEELLSKKVKMMAEGGEIGVHKQSPIRHRGTSLAGTLAKYDTRERRYYDMVEGKYKDKAWTNQQAKEEHAKVINESRTMPKPKLKGLAEGGLVDLVKAEHGEGDEDHDEKKLKRMARIAKMMR